ncbi:hypothetical protein DSLASN_26970 [Desulfoluna limicola]|uniref:Uncharacterized protein n=1 Tax=Desulfoluna limicola TaxID=2810562 RepID=A0ABM7PIE7_9BACT|nr:Rnf-Nqr domain containing protein [Desulfoluna limicola]BCS97065.1 hypothetical protein DSLASN_26970 [Desulfoluna limicola]
MKSIGHHLGHFYYGLWIALPGWVVFFSLFWLVSVFSVCTNAAPALFIGVGTALILVGTNVFFSWASSSPCFQRDAHSSLRYLLPALRGMLYLLCASMIVPFFELLFRLLAPDVYQGVQQLSPYIPIGCLILSQFGGFPHHHSVRDSAMDGAFTGAGFTLFLLFVGIATQHLALSGKNPFYGAVLGGIVLGMIAYAGREWKKARHPAAR